MNHEDYVIHTDEEPLRLERQARLYDMQAELQRLRLGGSRRVVDAGCGSGAMARAIARAAPQAEVIGIDRNPQYIAYAQRRAVEEGLGNLRFEVGDVTALPWPDGSVDVVWAKHLLQWVPQREGAVREFVRVTRPGGQVHCVNFDQFLVAHHPVDPVLQPQVEHWMAQAAHLIGFDNQLGPKLPVLLRRAGLVDIAVDVTADSAFSGFGGEPERMWNWGVQLRGSAAFTERVFGTADAARAYEDRLMKQLGNPDVFVACPLYHVSGTVPG
jgi:ubiquinone/menaquinone biosynthesis C-methylase UbiE